MDTKEPKKEDTATEPKKEDDPASNGKVDTTEEPGTKTEDPDQVKKEESVDKEDTKMEDEAKPIDVKEEEKEKPSADDKDVKEKAPGGDTEMEDVKTSPSDDKKRKAEDEEPKDGKRKRKSAEAFQPEDFSQPKSLVNVKKGRGDRLREIPGVKESIESYSVHDDIFAHAYRFIFVTRGRLPKGEAKQQMLDYSGYLPEIDESEDKAKVEQHDEELETKYSKRAYKMTVPQIKAMCDLFDVDRTPGPEPKVDKDVMIDRLLDFLSAPDAQYTNAHAKKNKKAVTPAHKKKKSTSSSPKKSAAKKAPSDKDISSEEDEEEEAEAASADDEKDGDSKMPSDSRLRKWVKCYVGCYNMNKATVKHALEICSSKFGMDMTPKKKTIKMMLTEEC